MEKLTRLEAEYMAYQYAWSYISEATDVNSDFYNSIGSSSIIDKNKLDEKNLFYPNDKEIKLILSEMKKLDKKLHRNMMKIREKTGFKFKI